MSAVPRAHLAGSLLACMLVVGCGSEADSPEALWARSCAAIAAQDHAARAGFYAPGDHALMAVRLYNTASQVPRMVSMARYAPNDEETSRQIEARIRAAQEELTAITKKHGFQQVVQEFGKAAYGLAYANVKEEDLLTALARRYAEQVGEVDLGAVMADFLPYLEKYGREPGDSPEPLPESRLEDLRVEGDTATARSGQTDVRFVRVDNRWFLSARAP